MNCHGIEIIEREIAKGGFFFKCIVNRTDAVFFEGQTQHRDIKVADVSYEDDYKGNALAATITPGSIDVRYHERYTDEVVKNIFGELLALDEVSALSRFVIRYQGRTLRNNL